MLTEHGAGKSEARTADTVEASSCDKSAASISSLDTRMSEETMVDAGIEVKVEDYDGTYVCLFCGESVRGQPALKCSHCSSNPFHLACVALAHSKYAEVCPTCDRKTVEAWGRASGGTAGPSERSLI